MIRDKAWHMATDAEVAIDVYLTGGAVGCPNFERSVLGCIEADMFGCVCSVFKMLRFFAYAEKRVAFRTKSSHRRKNERKTIIGIEQPRCQIFARVILGFCTACCGTYGLSRLNSSLEKGRKSDV